MKKVIFTLLVVAFAGLGFFLVVSRETLPGAQPNADFTTEPTGSELSQPSRSGPIGVAPTIVENPAAATIPLIDGADPAYATALVGIERSIAQILSSSKFVDKLTDEQLTVLIKKLSVARLSQTMYEAEIAESVPKPDQVVFVAVPAYLQQGSFLEKYVFEELLQGLDDKSLKTSLTVRFFHFGACRQTLRFSPAKSDYPEKVYHIFHELEATPHVLRLQLGSTLPVSQFKDFTPFATWLTKS